MKGKLITKLFYLVALLLLVFGCADLEPKFSDSVSVDTSDETFSGDATQLLATAYNRLGNFASQAHIYALMEITSDEIIAPARGVAWGDNNGMWQILHSHNWDESHDHVLSSWNQLNSSAFICNQVLASNPSASQEAQARFIRALKMYYVMDLYGQVPFREVNEGVDVDPKVMSRVEAFDFIVNDLETALPGLDNANPTSDANLVSKPAAYALLAKLYLNKAVYIVGNAAGPYTFTKEDMDKVIMYCDSVTTSGYILEDGDYFDIFKKSSASEIILSVSSTARSTQQMWGMTLHPNQRPETGDAWNGFTTLAEFYDKFDSEGQRIGQVPGQGIGRGFLIGQQYGDSGEPLKDLTGKPLIFRPDIQLIGNDETAGIRAVKYHPDDAGDFILMRYADVYLMKIEAILRGGESSDGESAQRMLDQFRSVRGVAPIAANLDNLLDERGRELYWEGWRRSDQVRFGTYTNTWSEKTVTESHRVLFPIPQEAIDSNPNLEQNPGY